MRVSIISPVLLFLGSHLTSAWKYSPQPECQAGFCLCGPECQALEQDQTCCPRRGRHAEHICGPGRECCGAGCCREGWGCGRNEMCYPRVTRTSSQRTNCITTIITVVRPVPEHPTTDAEISGTLTTVSSVSGHSSGNHASTSERPEEPTSVIPGGDSSDEISSTAGASTVPNGDNDSTISASTTTLDETNHGTGSVTPTVVTNSDGQVSTVPSHENTEIGVLTSVTSSECVIPTIPPPDSTGPDVPTFITNTQGQSSTVSIPDNNESNTISSSIITGPDGQVSTILHTTEDIDTAVPTLITNSDGQVSTLSDDNDITSAIPTVVTNSDGEVSTIFPTTEDIDTSVPTVITNSDGQVSTVSHHEGTSSAIPIVVTNSDGEVSTIFPTTEDIESTVPTVVTGPDGQESTIGSQAPTDSKTAIPTLITQSDGQVSTIVPPETETGSTGSNDQVSTVETDSAILSGTVTTNSEGQVSTIFPTESAPSDENSSTSAESSDAPETGTTAQETTKTRTVGGDTSATEATETQTASGSSSVPTGSSDAAEATSTQETTATGTAGEESSATDATQTHGTETSSNNSSPTTESSDVTEPTTQGESTGTKTTATETTNAETKSNPGTSQSTQSNAVSSGETVGSETSTLTETESDDTKTTAPTSQSDPDEPTTNPGDPTTQAEPEETDSEGQPTTDDGQVTSRDGDDNSSPSTQTTPPPTTTTDDNVVIPITTSVDGPKPTDDGFVIPCNLWFFNICIGPIFGWKMTRPPGIYPPGPPPSISIPPGLGIEININGNLPDWPEFTIGPDNNPTFSEEPTDCETESAELCMTSTSYSVSVDATTTSTVTSQVTAMCGTVYGCNVEGATETLTEIETSTASNSPTATPFHPREQWPNMVESQEAIDAAASHAQSELHSIFGTRTTDPATPSASCPVLAKLENGGGDEGLQRCRTVCELEQFKPVRMYPRKVNDVVTSTFCNGTTVPINSTANREFVFSDTSSLMVQVFTATSQDGCKPQSEFTLDDYCRTSLGLLTECDSDSNVSGGGIFLDKSEYGCLVWSIGVINTTDPELGIPRTDITDVVNGAGSRKRAVAGPITIR